MCGIVGVVKNSKNGVSDAISVLKKLEYRGYDSAGVAILNEENKLEIQKTVGKIAQLEKLIFRQINFDSNVAIGHTRWATHGKVSAENSHPHFTEKVAVVHNGIIENYKEIRKKMEDAGYEYKTQTDTENIAVLITYFLDLGFDCKTAFQKAIEECHGAYAICAIFNGQPNFIAVAKSDSPMVIGTNENGEKYICSDINAISEYVDKAYNLNDGDIGFITEDGIEMNNLNHEVEMNFTEIDKESITNDMGEYDTFMMKEIMEQPAVIGGIINHYFDVKSKIHFKFPDFKFQLTRLDEINIVACGTSYHAGLTSSYYFEKYAGVNANAFVASEFRYQDYNFKPNGVFIFISQSGETADTIACLKLAKENRQHIVSIVNNPNSTIDKLSDAVLYCNAGVEVGVASTKAFTAQLSILIMLALRIGLKKHIIHREEGRMFANILLNTGNDMTKIMKLRDDAKRLAERICKAKHIMVVGRNVSYGIALEGALKIKEITYIPTSALPSGELKHGTIALVDKETPIIVIGIPDHTFQKTCSNVEEILAREGQVYLISDRYGVARFDGQIADSITMPDCNNFTAPLSYAIIMQFVAYYAALKLKRNIDKPRNLAKSVTVE